MYVGVRRLGKTKAQNVFPILSTCVQIIYHGTKPPDKNVEKYAKSAKAVLCLKLRLESGYAYNIIMSTLKTVPTELDIMVTRYARAIPAFLSAYF